VTGSGAVGSQGRRAASTIAADAGTGGFPSTASPRPGFVSCRIRCVLILRMQGHRFKHRSASTSRVRGWMAWYDWKLRVFATGPVQPRDLDSLTALNGDPHNRHHVQEALDWMIEEWHRIRIWYAKLFLEPPQDWFDLFCLLQRWRGLGYHPAWNFGKFVIVSVGHIKSAKYCRQSSF
jgi:hypothetical protein